MSKGIPSATTLRYHAPLPRASSKLRHHAGRTSVRILFHTHDCWACMWKTCKRRTPTTGPEPYHYILTRILIRHVSSEIFTTTSGWTQPKSWPTPGPSAASAKQGRSPWLRWGPFGALVTAGCKGQTNHGYCRFCYMFISMYIYIYISTNT